MAGSESSISLTPHERERIERVVGKWLKLIRNAHSATARDHLTSALIETFSYARESAADKDELAEIVAQRISFLVPQHNDAVRVRFEGRAIVRSALDQIVPREEGGVSNG
jgi:hypothetical protein